MTRSEAASLINERTGGTWSADRVADALDALRDGVLSKISLGTSYGWLLGSADGYTVKRR